MRTRLCITPNIASPPPFVLEPNTSHIIPKMAANESGESQESVVRRKINWVSFNDVIDETLRRRQEDAIPHEDPDERFVRWNTTLVSVIDETLRKYQENAIPNAQGAILPPPHFIDLLLWKGEALESLPRYIQYLHPADLTRDTVPPWETPPPVGYGPKEWWKWSPDLTEEDPEERLVRLNTTLVSVIDEALRKRRENAIPNAQGAITSTSNFIDLLLWKGEALESLPRYIQYLRPADLTRDDVPPWETPPPVGYGPKEWWKWSPDLTESEPESPESPESCRDDMSGIAGEVEETQWLSS
jgi:hypothetical protein